MDWLEGDADELLVSPRGSLELELLHETGRLSATAQKLIAALEHDLRPVTHNVSPAEACD